MRFPLVFFRKSNTVFKSNKSNKSNRHDNTKVEVSAVDEHKSNVLELLESFLRRFVSFPSDDHLRVVALWVISTWCFKLFQTTPYLYVSGPKQSGKTRMLDVMNVLARNALRGENMTTSIMFQLIELKSPTLLIDEVDTIWSGSRNEPKRQLINTGYKLGGVAYRQRGLQPMEYSTFCPKVLAGIRNGFLPDTVIDRCIPIPMSPKKRGSKVERFNSITMPRAAATEEVLQAIEEFLADSYVDLTAQRPAIVSALNDRQNEICEPLLAIANVLGVEQELRESLMMIFAEQGAQLTPDQIILKRIKHAFKGEEKVFTEVLIEALGSSYSGRQLALYLEKFNVAPTDIRIGNDVKRGYLLADFEEVFSIYLEEESPEEELERLVKETEEQEAQS